MNGPALDCERCSSAITADDLRCPICNLTCPASRDEDLAHTAVEILRCSGCGAAMTYDVSKLAAACAFPAWVLAYRYKDRLYRTVLSGQDENCLRGEAPTSIARIAAVVAAAAAAIVALLALMLF